MEIEFGVVFKMARGRGTRDGKELELSAKSNKACKSKNGMLLCAFKQKWLGGVELE